MTSWSELSNKLTHLSILGAITSPFIEVGWIQVAVWILTAISAIVSIYVNVKKLFNKKRTRRQI